MVPSGACAVPDHALLNASACANFLTSWSRAAKSPRASLNLAPYFCSRRASAAGDFEMMRAIGTQLSRVENGIACMLSKNLDGFISDRVEATPSRDSSSPICRAACGFSLIAALAISVNNIGIIRDRFVASSMALIARVLPVSRFDMSFSMLR